MSEPLLRLDGFGAAFGDRVILSTVDLAVGEREAFILMGPAGTGKSTLVRSLAGFNEANPSFRTWGSVRYAGTDLGEGDRPALVAQSATLMMASVLQNIVQDLPERSSLSPLQQRELATRLLTEAGLHELCNRLDEPVIRLPLATQRHLAILRLAAAGPRLLCVDEPTTGLNPVESQRLLAYISRESTRRTMLVVLHNQQHARYLGGRIALLAGGVIQEAGNTRDFLTTPTTAAGKTFIRSGSCTVPAPGAAPETLDPDVESPAPVPPEATNYVSDSFGPRGFLWLKKGRLAGTPRPGIFLDIGYDLKALSRVGITCLITLTETPPDSEALGAHGLKHHWHPIPDMQAPTSEQCADICRRIDALLKAGDAVAVHCRAGLGRTGTILAAYLIWEGASALDALEQTRRVEPRWVQSEVQVEFLSSFETFCANESRQQTGRLASSA